MIFQQVGPGGVPAEIPGDSLGDERTGLAVEEVLPEGEVPATGRPAKSPVGTARVAWLLGQHRALLGREVVDDQLQLASFGGGDGRHSAAVRAPGEGGSPCCGVGHDPVRMEEGLDPRHFFVAQACNHQVDPVGSQVRAAWQRQIRQQVACRRLNPGLTESVGADDTGPQTLGAGVRSTAKPGPSASW